MSKRIVKVDHTRPCPRGHIEGRYKNGKCKVCSKAEAARWRVANPDKAREKERRRPKRVLTEEQKEKKKITDALWKVKNKDLVNLRARIRSVPKRAELAKAVRDRRLADPEKTKQDQKRWRSNPAVREKIRLWFKRNPHVRTLHEARRRASRTNATPRWSDKKRIREIYKRCARLKKCLGIQLEVDHIVPLRSKYVCGLHVPCNLRIVSKTVNLRKLNREWPDMTVWS